MSGMESRWLWWLIMELNRKRWIKHRRCINVNRWLVVSLTWTSPQVLRMVIKRNERRRTIWFYLMEHSSSVIIHSHVFNQVHQYQVSPFDTHLHHRWTYHPFLFTVYSKTFSLYTLSFYLYPLLWNHTNLILL